MNEYVENLYLEDEYLAKNPLLHIEDSLWKVSRIIHPIDRFINLIDKDEINLLDVGGGAGLILNEISAYIEQSYGIKVNKFALDLSPGMLEIQKKRNPDLKKALNEDIQKTSLSNKEIDLTLMIDVLEHVPNPVRALREVKRISKFAVFKVPLEDCFIFRLWNLARRDELRHRQIKTVGHINTYHFSKIKHQIEKYAGEVLDFHFTNISDYFLKGKMGVTHKLVNLLAAYTFRISPKFSSFIFRDHTVILAKCYA